MTDPATLHRPTRGPLVTSIWGPPAQIALALAAVAAALVPISRLLEVPAKVDAIVVDNPTRYDIAIDATDDDGGGHVAAGTAERMATTRFDLVIDQGDVWIFDLRAQGHDAGQIVLDRQQLADAGWTVRLTPEIGEDLRAQGAPYPP